MDTASSYCPVKRDTPAEVSSIKIIGSFSLPTNFCHKGSSSASGNSLRPYSCRDDAAREEVRPARTSKPKSSTTSVQRLVEARALPQRWRRAIRCGAFSFPKG